MFWMCFRGEAILIHIYNMILCRNIESNLFLLFRFRPRFPLFSLYVRWKSGVTFVRRCFRDDCVNLPMTHFGLRKCCIYDVITISSKTSMLVAFISLEHTGKSVNNMFSNGEAKFIQFIYLGIIDLFNVF